MKAGLLQMLGIEEMSSACFFLLSLPSKEKGLILFISFKFVYNIKAEKKFIKYTGIDA